MESTSQQKDRIWWTYYIAASGRKSGISSMNTKPRITQAYQSSHQQAATQVSTVEQSTCTLSSFPRTSRASTWVKHSISQHGLGISILTGDTAVIIRVYTILPWIAAQMINMWFLLLYAKPVSAAIWCSICWRCG